MLDWLTAKFGRPARAASNSAPVPAASAPVEWLNFRLTFALPLYVDIKAADTDAAEAYAGAFLVEFLKKHPGTELRHLYRAGVVPTPRDLPRPEAPSAPLPPPAPVDAHQQETSK